MNLKFKKKRNLFNNRNVIIHKYDKYMLLSCTRLSSNRYELNYLINYSLSFNEDKMIIPIKTIISFDDYMKISKIKFGIWIHSNCSFSNCFVYIYRNLKNNHVIFKYTKNNNHKKLGYINQYNHQLLFKGMLLSNAIIEQVGGSYG